MKFAIICIAVVVSTPAFAHQGHEMDGSISGFMAGIPVIACAALVAIRRRGLTG